MQILSFIFAAAAAFRVAHADFMVYTMPPIPTDQIPRFTDPAEVSLPPLSRLSAKILTSHRLQAGPSAST